MKKSKQYFLILPLAYFFAIFFLLPLQINDVLALENSTQGLREKRESFFSSNSTIFKTRNNVKILIVPGHDDQYWGTEFEGVKEVELNRELASNLFNFLKDDYGFEVQVVSDENGYTKEFKKFFEREEKEIKDFIKRSQKDFKRKIKDGDIQFEGKGVHNKAPEEVAFRLYGINLWANENDFDLVIHVHFNDYPGRHKDYYPKYNGFSIYVPEEQFSNHEISFDFAKNIFDRISQISAPSNLPLEKDGIIETQELIAIGSHETLEVPSILIEYGYVYESKFTHPDLRQAVLNDLAKQTYLGIKDYFGENVFEDKNFIFDKNLSMGEFWTKENYLLQKELALNNFYPPQNKNLNNCPISGYFGKCTLSAVKEFQKQNKLPTTGFVGPMTREVLNSK